MKTVPVDSLVEAARPVRGKPADEHVCARAEEIAQHGFDEKLVVYKRRDRKYEAVDDVLNVRALHLLDRADRLPCDLAGGVTVEECQDQHAAEHAAHRKSLRNSFGPVAEALYAQSVLAKTDLHALEISELANGKPAGRQHQPGSAAYLRRLTGFGRQYANDLVHRTRIPEHVLRELQSCDGITKARLTSVGKSLYREQPAHPAARARALLQPDDQPDDVPPTDVPPTMASGDEAAEGANMSKDGYRSSAPATASSEVSPEQNATRDAHQLYQQDPEYQRRYLAQFLEIIRSLCRDVDVDDLVCGTEPEPAALDSHPGPAVADGGPAQALGSANGSDGEAARSTPPAADNPASAATAPARTADAVVDRGPLKQPVTRAANGDRTDVRVGGNANRGPQGGAADPDEVGEAKQMIFEIASSCCSLKEVSDVLGVPIANLSRIRNQERASHATVEDIRHGYRHWRDRSRASNDA